ncbi:MAG: hypothetical protein H6716_22980 [Polyangiaceae bacterium]|nr:hypothetical protein [Polyangiaceae bacterium]
MAKRRSRSENATTAQSYRHPESELALRPDVGTQDQFKKKKKPVTYRTRPVTPCPTGASTGVPRR